MAYLIQGAYMVIRPFLIIASIYLLIIAGAYILKKQDRLRHNGWCIKEALFVSYIVSVLWITGVICSRWSFGIGQFNLEFMTGEDLKLMVFNLLLFCPLGLFLPAIFFKGRKYVWVMITGMLCSITIEMIQMLFVGRLADIDDIFFNTAGCAAGLGIYHLIKGKQVPDYTFFVSLLAVIWNIRYRMVSIGDVVFSALGASWILNDKFYYTECCGIILGVIALALSAGKSRISFCIGVAAILLGLTNMITKYLFV